MDHGQYKLLTIAISACVLAVTHAILRASVAKPAGQFRHAICKYFRACNCRT